MPGILSELNDQQKEAATYRGSAQHVLVNAGAGCGKTRTVIARAAYLCKSGTNASRILVMTFTNRAARELKQRLKRELGESAEAIQAGTFHAFCLKVMSQLPASFEVSGLHVIDTDDQNSLIKLVRKTHIKMLKGPKKGFPSSEQLLNFYSYSRNTCQDPVAYLKKQTDLEDEYITVCASIFAAYQKAKEERGYLDFDDLLERFSAILGRKSELRKAVCTLFDEVLVDEMQDTNPIQFSILKHFSSEGVRLFCVGDPAQSIYRFRGAEFKHIYAFNSIFGNSITLPLSINYRSYQEILDFSNWLLNSSCYAYNTNLEANRGKNGVLPRLEEFEYQNDEANWIADYVVSCTERKIRLADIMVLYRTAYGARPLEAELIRRSIPYRFIGGMVLTKSAHVRDVLSLLRLARNPKDDLAWMRYLQLWPRIGEKTAEHIFDAVLQGKQSPGGVTETLCTVLGSEHPATKAYNATVEHYEKPVECIKTCIEQLQGVLSEQYDHWKQRYKDLELLLRVAQNYRSTSQFIDDFTLEPLNDTQIREEFNDDALTLITVHSAKGTEASICIVADATQLNYPHVRSLGDLEAEEEERRVLYVACTRAKNELIITRSSVYRNAFWVEHSPACGQSYFLEELPEDRIAITSHGWFPETDKNLQSLRDVY